MPTLIDGHNLIPKLGLSLRSLDDEMQLVARLQEFCRAERKKSLEVYFDGAPAGQVGTRKMGLVTAHFVRLGATADSAIRARLKTLGRAARNWTVVTSDRQVQADAHSAGAAVVSSEAFAARVNASTRAPAPGRRPAKSPQGAKSAKRAKSPQGERVEGSAKEAGMSEEEVEEWLRLFREKER